MKRKGGNWLWNWLAFFYDQFYKSFPPYLSLHQEIFRDLKDSAPDSGYTLDAGCGTGLLSVGLARRGYPVVGIDQSLAMLDRAWVKKKRENLGNLFFFVRDLNGKLNLSEYSFRRIIFVHSLYLMSHPQETLKNLSSLLPPGGEVIMCNPSRRLTSAELLAGGRSFLKEAFRENRVFSLLGVLAIALAMGALNVVIQKRKKTIYYCWSEKEIQELLRSCNFRLNWLKKSCLADSHLLLSAVKER